MDYSTLVNTIKAYSENTFPETTGSDTLTTAQQLSTFVNQAERRIYNSVQLPFNRKSATGSTTTSNRYLSVPSDWLSSYSMAVIDPSTGAYTYLLYKDPEFIREAFPIPTATGTPTHYALYDVDSFVLGPTPDASYTVEHQYFYYPESIVTASTTWLGDNFDQVLLYGSLLEAAAFMKSEEDTVKMYQERYNEALATLKQFAEGKLRQDTYRTPQVRYPVR
jgi:hypothetical protein